MAKVNWTPTATTAGIRLRWAVHEAGESPSYGSPVDVDASLGEYDIGEVTIPLSHILTVELTGWSEFSGGSVSGESGTPVLLQRRRGGVPTPVASPGSELCRLVFTDDLDLVLTNDLCLILTVEA